MAAAYAETGHFAKVIEIARDALRLATAQGDSGLAAELQEELAIYQVGLPYREGPKKSLSRDTGD
jgi:hypothetical protein